MANFQLNSLALVKFAIIFCFLPLTLSRARIHTAHNVNISAYHFFQ